MTPALRQILVAVLGLPAVWLVTVPPGPGWAVAGCALGLASQPFWIVETCRARQWGMFALSWIYTFAWLRGLACNLGGI